MRSHLESQSLTSTIDLVELAVQSRMEGDFVSGDVSPSFPSKNLVNRALVHAEPFRDRLPGKRIGERANLTHLTGIKLLSLVTRRDRDAMFRHVLVVLRAKPFRMVSPTAFRHAA